MIFGKGAPRLHFIAKHIVDVTLYAVRGFTIPTTSATPCGHRFINLNVQVVIEDGSFTTIYALSQWDILSAPTRMAGLLIAKVCFITAYWATERFWLDVAGFLGNAITIVLSRNQATIQIRPE